MFQDVLTFKAPDLVILSKVYGFLSQKHQSWVQLSNGDWELGTILTTIGAETLLSLPEGKVSNKDCCYIHHSII